MSGRSVLRRALTRAREASDETGDGRAERSSGRSAFESFTSLTVTSQAVDQRLSDVLVSLSSVVGGTISVHTQRKRGFLRCRRLLLLWPPRGCDGHGQRCREFPSTPADSHRVDSRGSSLSKRLSRDCSRFVHTRTRREQKSQRGLVSTSFLGVRTRNGLIETVNLVRHGSHRTSSDCRLPNSRRVLHREVLARQ